MILYVLEIFELVLNFRFLLLGALYYVDSWVAVLSDRACGLYSMYPPCITIWQNVDVHEIHHCRRNPQVKSWNAGWN